MTTRTLSIHTVGTDITILESRLDSPFALRLTHTHTHLEDTDHLLQIKFNCTTMVTIKTTLITLSGNNSTSICYKEIFTTTCTIQ